MAPQSHDRVVSRRYAMLGVGAVLIAPAMRAHRLHMSYTNVLWSASLKRIAVTHRLDINDLRTAVLKDRSASFESLRARAMCALYVSQRFSIVGENGPLKLETIGAEAEGRHIFAYQDASGPPLRSATVTNRILVDAFPDQVNRVNLDMGSGVRTLIFTGHDRDKSVVLD